MRLHDMYSLNRRMLSKTPNAFGDANTSDIIQKTLDSGDSMECEPNHELKYRKLDLERFERTLYTVGEAAACTHCVFPLSGGDNLNVLRKSFQIHLPPCHISNEYGEITPLADISSHHLPTLQAKLWRDELAASSKSPTSSCVRSEDLGHFVRGAKVSVSLDEDKKHRILAIQSEGIASLLSCKLSAWILLILLTVIAGFVFVAGSKRYLRCCNPICTTLEDGFHSTILTIEPYYHWDTLTFASDISSDQGKILVFRRTGTKSQDPLWIHEIQRLELQNPICPSYCIPCLTNLMLNRIPIGSTIHQGKMDNRQMSIGAAVSRKPLEPKLPETAHDFSNEDSEAS